MTEFIDEKTGEVHDGDDVQVSRNEFVLKADALRNAASPTNPVEMEFFIREANALLEQLPSVLLEINERRYAAERAHSRRKNEQMAFYGRQGMAVTFARAQAESDAMPELEVWHGTKAEYHYAEDTERALRTKIYSMLNINKAVVAQYGSYGGGQR
jgi:hypothetical protein